MHRATHSTILATAACLALAHHTLATWSIVVVNKQTGEVGVACATCLEGFDLLQGTPVMVVGRGGASAQSSVDVGGYNRTILRNQILQNVNPSTILVNVRAGDSNANGRQYGVATTRAAVASATYTGPLAAQWAGGVTGQFSTPQGDFAYAVQGNILTGANVVNDARDALINTPGALPERLMAAMEAARSGGGDGRCSCSPGAPTSCGSPPPAPFKSAHVGYMIIGRAGDLDAGLAAYRAGMSPLGVAVGDLNLDGSMDVVSANNGSSNVSIFRNSITSPDRFLRLNTPTTSVFSGGPRGIVLRDVTGDNRPDAFVTAFSGNQVVVKPATTAGSFGAAEQATVGNGPINLILADIVGTAMPEIITANFLGGSVSVVPINSALPTGITLGAPTTVATGGQPIALAAADIDGDADLDIVVADFGNARLVPLINSAGVLLPAANIPLASGAGDVVAADFDSDGDTDLAAACQTDGSIFLIHNNSGVLTPTRVPMTFPPTKLRVGDLNNDGAADLAVLGSNAFATYLSQGGVLSNLVEYPGPPDTQSHVWSALDLADMDRDGDLDMVVTQNVSPGGVAMMENLGGTAGRTVGTFRAGVGQALGDYYLNLNVPNAQTGDPDPVATLHEQFNAWRASLVGVPDALQSAAAIDRAIIEPACPGTLTVTLRDWQGTLVTPPLNVAAAHEGPGTALLTFGSATQSAPGVYTLPLSVQNLPASGEESVQVTVTGFGLARPIVLMPTTRVRALRTSLTDIDFNNDTLFPDTADIESFLCVFAGGTCGCDPVLHCDSIDFNQDNIFPDALDLTDFLEVFAGRGCGG